MIDYKKYCFGITTRSQLHFIVRFLWKGMSFCTYKKLLLRKHLVIDGHVYSCLETLGNECLWSNWCRGFGSRRAIFRTHENTKLKLNDNAIDLFSQISKITDRKYAEVKKMDLNFPSDETIFSGRHDNRASACVGINLILKVQKYKLPRDFLDILE